MRKVAMRMLLAVLFAATNAGAADRVEVLNGSLRVAQPAEQWQQTDVVITPEAQKYPAQWQQAFKNPGTIVPVKASVKICSMIDAVHQQRETLLELGVVLTGDKVIDIVPGEGKVVRSETLYNPYIFFWSAAVLLMALFNWLVRRRDYKFFAAVAVDAAIFAAAAAAFAAAFATFAAAAVFAAFAAVFFAAVENSKVCRIVVAIFYMAMVLSIIAFYA